MTGQSAMIDSAIETLGGVNLPDGIELLAVAGEGSCAVVFKARHRGETVALKVYRPKVVARYRDRHDCNIAVYEMSQNRAFRKITELVPYSAKPIMVLGHDGKQSVSFMQEYIDGQTLEAFGKTNGGIPSSVIEGGEVIARIAKQHGLQGFGLDLRDVMVHQQSGRWLPVIQDFNRPPSGAAASKGFMGLFKKEQRTEADPIGQWRDYARQCGG